MCSGSRPIARNSSARPSSCRGRISDATAAGISGRDDSACVAGQRRIGRQSAAPGVDECLHRPIAADAGRPRTDSGIEPVCAGRLAIEGRRHQPLSGVVRRRRGCAAHPARHRRRQRVRQAFDAGTVEGQGTSSRRTRRAANPRRSAAADPRGRRHHRSSGSRGCGNRAARCGAGARPPRGLGTALSRAAVVAARLGGGQRQLCRFAARPKPGCAARPAISASPSADLPRWRRS